MRKLISVLLLVLLLSAPVCLAHGGRLDSNGGHWNHSTGEYHYHEGPHANNASSSHSESKPKASNDQLSTRKNTDVHQKPSAWSRFLNQEMTFGKIMLLVLVGVVGLPCLFGLISHICWLVEKRKR